MKARIDPEHCDDVLFDWLVISYGEINLVLHIPTDIHLYYAQLLIDIDCMEGKIDKTKEKKQEWP